MTENDLLNEIIKLCEKHDIQYYHSGDSRRDQGKGFPDLLLVGHHRILFVECKSPVGNMTTEQRIWLYRLVATGHRLMIWRPAHLISGWIEEELSQLLILQQLLTPDKPCFPFSHTRNTHTRTSAQVDRQIAQKKRINHPFKLDRLA